MHCIATVAVSLAVLTQYTNVTDRQTPSQTSHRTTAKAAFMHSIARKKLQSRILFLWSPWPKWSKTQVSAGSGRRLFSIRLCNYVTVTNVIMLTAGLTRVWWHLNSNRIYHSVNLQSCGVGLRGSAISQMFSSSSSIILYVKYTGCAKKCVNFSGNKLACYMSLYLNSYSINLVKQCYTKILKK